MKKLKIPITLLFVTVALILGGCKPYAAPELVTISPSETAYLVPLVGDTTNQAKFESESFLESRRVASKQIEVPKRWFQTGRMANDGKWIPSARVIIVDRKPVTREWTSRPNTGTSRRNQAIVAETKESTGFMARMTVTAQIDEEDATKFLYRYNTKSLSQVIDDDIRGMVQSKFVEECGKVELRSLLSSKQQIMESVRGVVIPFFKDRGVTVTVLGLTDEFTYLNPGIQESLNASVIAENNKKSAMSDNERKLATARAQSEAAKYMATAQGSAFYKYELEKLHAEIEKIKWSTWNGVLPQYMFGNSGMNMMMPFPGSSK